MGAVVACGAQQPCHLGWPSSHRPGISRGEPDRKLAFIDGPRCVTQASLHVGRGQLRVLGNDLLGGESICDEADDRGDRDAGTGHADRA